MAIMDTSSQDRVLTPRVDPKRRAMQIGAAVVAVVLIAWIAPSAWRLFTAGRSVSASRLQIATVERGPFVRDIAAEGRVVAAVSPDPVRHPRPARSTLQVHAGDTVKKGQVLAIDRQPGTAPTSWRRSSPRPTRCRSTTCSAQVDARASAANCRRRWTTRSIDAKSAETDLARQQKAFAAGAAARMRGRPRAGRARKGAHRARARQSRPRIE